MLLLKTGNELVYADFSKKDFNEFKEIHYKSNIYKVSIVVNSLLACNFTFLNKLGKFMSKHNRYYYTKVVLYTGFYNGNKIANQIIRKHVTDLKFRLVGGRIWMTMANGNELFMMKKPFGLRFDVNYASCYNDDLRKCTEFIKENYYPNPLYNHMAFSEDIQWKVYNDRLKTLLKEEIKVDDEPEIGFLSGITFIKGSDAKWV